MYEFYFGLNLNEENFVIFVHHNHSCEILYETFHKNIWIYERNLIESWKLERTTMPIDKNNFSDIN